MYGAIKVSESRCACPDTALTRFLDPVCLAMGVPVVRNLAAARFEGSFAEAEIAGAR